MQKRFVEISGGGVITYTPGATMAKLRGGMKRCS